jgi:Na+-transporting NADH:ubiquinone oxidoreductase subunit NqrC
LESRQDLLTGELRSINRQRAVLERQGQDLRSRIAAVLRGTLGLDSADLVKYGIQPRLREARRKRLSKAERAEQLARAAARANAELEAEKAVQAAAEAKLRASVAPPLLA